MTRLGRSLLLITLLIAAPFAFSAGRLPDLAPGKARYLMVLWQPGTPIPGSNGKHVGKVEEPDVKKLGGIVVEEYRHERVIDISVQAAEQLRKHPSVVNLQRLWMGEPIEELYEPRPASPARPEFAAEDDPLLTWGPREYTYDGGGNIIRIGKTGAYDNYTYDTAGRLIESTVGGKNETYAYDEFGNLISKGVVGANTTAIPIDGASNRMQGATYDVAGNVTTRGDEKSLYSADAYAYDSFNMLVQYKNERRILYDVNDERIGAIRGETSQWWVRDLEGRVLREYRGGSASTWGWVQDYIYAEGQLVAGESVLWDGRYGTDGDPRLFGGVRHHHLDHLGSVRLVTDPNGRSLSEHDYFPFGVTPTKTYQEEINWFTKHIDAMRFAGHQREFLGPINTDHTEYLDYMHARYYDPNVGRFLSVDPGKDWDVHQPQTWNLYMYARNNPMLFIDPTGRAAYVTVIENGRRRYSLDADEDGISDEIAATRAAIAEAARHEAGNNDWSRDGSAPPGVGSFKCSSFVGDVLQRASVPVPRNKIHNTPVSAGDWGNPDLKIYGWQIVNAARPGDIIASRNAGASLLDVPIVGGIAIRWFGAASGHVAIVTGPQRTTGASPEGVRTKMWPWRPDDDDAYVIRRYVGF